MSKRRWPIVGASTLAFVAVLAIGGPWLYSRIESARAPAPLTATLAAPPSAVGTADFSGTWKVGAGSQAGYRVHEVLNGNPTTVVGRTDDVTGSVDISGSSLQAGSVTVDLASVATNSTARDNQFRTTVMDVKTYPTARFVVTQPADLAALRTSGTVSVELAGTLTIKDATRSVTATLDVAGPNADGLAVVAGSIPVTFEDFDVTPPSLGFVTVEPSGTIEFRLVLAK